MQQLNALYAVYRLYVNHFLPIQKLVSKVRDGSKVKQVYDDPKTPYQRVLDSDQVSKEAKRKLRAIQRHLRWRPNSTWSHFDGSWMRCWSN